MGNDIKRDQLVLIRIEGMHCHKCERAIQNALKENDGVHEVEVDFNSGQASILLERGTTSVAQLLESVARAGYRTTGFTQGSSPAA